MTKDEYKNQIDILFDKWKKEGYKHELYQKEGNRFSDDGIVDYIEWEKSKPRILFLLREDYSKDGDYEPCWGITVGNKPFSKNIARWRGIIKELYKDANKQLTIDNIELPKGINDIALVEVKKLNEGNSSTPYKVVMEWGEEDKIFIKEQIEIINPDIIFCCSTGDAYADHLYNNNEWESLFKMDIASKKYRSYKDYNRLIIDFYHPSTRNNTSLDIEYFEVLCKMIKEGNVFEKFDWGKN